MQEADSEAMKTIAAAISSGSPARRCGTVRMNAALLFSLPADWSSIFVCTGPGATTFTRMPHAALRVHRPSSNR